MTTQLATTDQTFAPMPISELKEMAGEIAASKMFPGIRTPAQAFALMLICQAEGQNPVLALRRYHVISMGQGDNANTVITMRADYMQGAYEERGNLIIWHRRDDEECSATFIKGGKSNGESNGAIKRAKERYKLQSKSTRTEAENDKLVDLGEPNEMLIIRTRADATAKKLDQTYKDGVWKPKFIWQQNPRQLLHARCLTEGVRATDPGLIAGIMGTEEAEDAREIDGMQTLEAAGQLKEKREEIVGPVIQEIKPEPEKPTQIPDWKTVPVHFATTDAFMRDANTPKTLGELLPEHIAWLATDWLPRPKSGKKDEGLALAVEAAVAAGADKQAEQASPATEKTEPAPNPVTEAKKAATRQPRGKKEPEKPAETAPNPEAWRDVIVSPKCKVQGWTVGKVMEMVKGGLETDPDTTGSVWIFTLHNKLIPKLDKEKDAELIAAIKSAAEYCGALLEGDELRVKLMNQFEAMDLTPDKAEKLLVDAGIFSKGDTFQSADEDLIRYALEHWFTVKLTLPK